MSKHKTVNISKLYVAIYWDRISFHLNKDRYSFKQA